jgi:RimJ/RimL family protein N-acetyltransferase
LTYELELRVASLADGASAERLTTFLSTNDFPFHVMPRRSREQVQSDINSGRYTGSLVLELWAEGQCIGFAAFDDIEDDGAMLDLRIASQWRQCGIGTLALPLSCSYVFEHHANRRIEGVTREDNTGMRKVFRRSGFVLESVYRSGWTAEEPNLAALGYSLLRSDWESGTTTPVSWQARLAEEGGLA